MPAHPLARKSGGGRPRGGRPLPRAKHFATPGASEARRAVERRSATPLVYLYGLPRWVVPVVMVVLLLAAFVMDDWRGGLAVLPVLGLVGWLAYMSWPSLGRGARLLRVALGTFLLLLALDRFGLF